jgi:hypothetical protein
MRLRREGLRTGQLLTCFPVGGDGRNASLLFLVEGAADIAPLQRIQGVLQSRLDDSCQWSTVANQLDLSAVDPRLDPERLTRLEAAEFRDLEAGLLEEVLAPAMEQLRKGERVRFPSATRLEGSVARSDDFLGREQELASLKERVRQRRHTLLVAPRRSGKTTLLYRLKEELTPEMAVTFVDCQRRGSAQAFAAELWGLATGQPFTTALKEVRGGKWEDFVQEALKRFTDREGRPCCLILDELSMFLEHAKPASDGPALLGALDKAVGQVGATVIAAGSIDLRRWVKQQAGPDLPGLFAGLADHPLPPLAEGRLGLYLRQVLLGTGLVAEQGDLPWLEANVDLAMPYPALQFLSHLASVARERALTTHQLEEELQGFLQTTSAFRETEAKLSELAQDNAEQAERVEQVLSLLADRDAGMPTLDVKARLAAAAEEQAGQLAWLLEHLPLRVAGGQMRIASRLFRRYWQQRMQRAEDAR